MKKTRFVSVFLSLTLVFTMLPFNMVSFAAVKYMPDVTKEMSKASFWTDKLKDPDALLATADEISAINQSLYENVSIMTDLRNWSQETYDGIAFNEALKTSGESDAEYLWDMGAQYDEDGNRYSDWHAKYDEAIANTQDPDASAEMPVRYAICTYRSVMQILPTDDSMSDDPNDPDFDYLYHTMLYVNEPLILKATSADGQYYHATSSCVSGWVRAEDVAICAGKEEWLDAWDFPSEDTLVVYDDKIYTEDSNYAPETANRKLPMGTFLELADESEWTNLISNRSAHNNHVVWMPVREADGSYRKQLALIGENRKVNEGYLPMTYSNLIGVIMNQLGDVYGWGGMMGAEDCSGYIRDVFRCFGLEMKRWVKSTDDSYAKVYDMKSMSVEEKSELLKQLPPGTPLSMSGHEMIYLGYSGDNFYVISELYSVAENGQIIMIRNCVINTLATQRGSGATWLESLEYAEIPYYSTSHADPANPYKSEAEEELAKAKTAAKSALENYKNADDYRDAQKTELASAIEAGKTAIDAAEDIAAVESALSAAKAEIDKIKTDAQLSAEEAAAAEAKAKSVTTVTVNVKNVKAATIAAAITAAGGKTEYVKTVVLGKKVKKISAKAFKGTEVTTLTVKSKKLTKKSVKKSLKGSQVKTVKVKVGKKKANKAYVKKYKKIFTKKNAGKKVKVV